MTDNINFPGDLTEAGRKISDIYSSWQFVGVDENGNDTYLPLSRKSIKYSKSLASAAKHSNPDDEDREELKYISKVLRSAMKRKMRASWKVVIISLILAGLWGWQLGAFTEPGQSMQEREGQELADFFCARMETQRKDIAETANIDIPETKAEIEEIQARIKAGISDEDLLKESKKDLRKKKDHLKFLDDYLDRHTEEYERRKDMTPDEYKADVIAVAQKEQVNARISMAFWLILVLFYMITSRRPYFLFWKKSFDDGTLSSADDVGAMVVSSALISSLVNFDRNSTQYVHWSDGTVTRETDLTGGGINIIFAIVLVMFYALFIVITLPIRIIWNLLRNYVLYF